MDNDELVLELIEHPERYSSEQIEDMLRDEETRTIYNTLLKAEAAVKSDEKIDVDAAWEDFSRKHLARRRTFLWFGSRAASIAAVVGTSIVAIAAGIAVGVTNRATGSGAEPGANITALPKAGDAGSVAVQADTASVDTIPVVFEDASLEAIMEKVAGHYGVEVRFNSRETASLHLYYKLDPALPLDKVVSQLNTFKRISITRKDNVLTVD